MKKIYQLNLIRSMLAAACMLSLSILLFSCDEDDPPRISLSTSELSFDHKSSSKSVVVETEAPWSTQILPEEAAEWCSLSLAHSDRSETINVYVEANLPDEGVTEERHATIVFSIGGGGSNTKTTLHVKQGIKPEQN